MNEDVILLADGGGGERTRRLLAERIVPKFSNPALDPLGDSALLTLPGGTLAMTTDAYVVQPLFFPGGDIGRLCVCGTVNDLCMAGAEPVALSLSLVMEEGLPLATLDRVLDSAASAARAARVSIVTGDTKVVERGPAEPGLTITTAGLGTVRNDAHLDPADIEPGDVILVSGPIAEHGLAIMSVREGLSFQTELRSDVAPLRDAVEALYHSGAMIKFLRDPTRGGLAGVLVDLAADSGAGVVVREADIPITSTARRAADILGLDPLNVANEGKLVAVVPVEDADRALTALRGVAESKHAAVIGEFSVGQPAFVELLTHGGGRRRVQRPYGEDLPRIC
jgi:hydrogenase expression/formation protein HypE